jgi:hypothetical protein
MLVNELAHAVDAFSHQAVRLTDAELGITASWDAPGNDRWRGYDSSRRELFFHVYQELRELAVDIGTERVSTAPPPTVQRVLAQHHIAFRDLTGALAGVADEELDREPAEGEWPLRDVIEHLMGAELGFLLQIEWALTRRDSGEAFPVPMPREGEAARRFDEIDVSGSLAAILSRYGALHQEIIDFCSSLTDADLDTPSVWWEDYPIPVRFRTQRWDAHLREHTIQVDKTLAGIGHPPSEAERLIRLIHNALGECEGTLIDAGKTASERQRAVAGVIADRTASL